MTTATKGMSFRNPPRPWRLLSVAMALAMPGGLGGALVGLWQQNVLPWATAGMVLGALAGAVVEGWSESG